MFKRIMGKAFDKAVNEYIQRKDKMFSETFRNVLTHNGVVSITTWANNQAHVANTWNVYLQITDDNRILIPAAWLKKTEANIALNNKVIVTLGSPDVQGTIGMGTGFCIEGTVKFLDSGKEFDMMKGKFSFLTRVLEITPTNVKQTI